MVLGSREHGAGGMSGKEMQLAPAEIARAAGSGASVPVESCQVCGHAPLTNVLSLGYMPPVNQMVPVGELPRQQPWFPTTLLYCENCELVQLGLAVDPAIIFPPEYPYTSGTTKLLRDNGYLGLRVPEEYGGAGATLSMQCLVLEELSRSHRLFTAFIEATSGLTPTEIDELVASLPEISEETRRTLSLLLSGRAREKSR